MTTYRLSHWPHYLLVTIAVLAIVVLESNIPDISKGLVTEPFTIVVVAAALLGNIYSGILAVILSGVAIDFVSLPYGFHLFPYGVLKTVEFLVTCLIIYGLCWAIRSLRQLNSSLVQAVQRLNDEAGKNQTELNKTRKLNEKLNTLVNEFIADDEWWRSRFKADFAAKTSKGFRKSSV